MQPARRSDTLGRFALSSCSRHTRRGADHTDGLGFCTDEAVAAHMSTPISLAPKLPFCWMPKRLPAPRMCRSLFARLKPASLASVTRSASRRSHQLITVVERGQAKFEWRALDSKHFTQRAQRGMKAMLFSDRRSTV
eukprot:6207042-Pleurochrysis_carterae.AAC.2